MTLRTRLQVSIALLAVVSVGGLAAAVRYEMTRRLGAEYQRRVDALVAVIRNDIAANYETIGARLKAMGGALTDDNQFRRGIQPAAAPSDRGYVIDYAGRVMAPAGLSLLTIEDADYRVLSSGQFRNEFDRVDSVARLSGLAASRPTLLQARTAEGSFLALVRTDTVRLGTNRLTLIGGVKMDRDYLRRLAQGEGLVVTLEFPGVSLSSADSAAQTSDATIAADVTLPFASQTPATEIASAHLVVTQSLAPLAALQQGVTRWSVFAGIAAALWALLLGTWLATRVSKPITDLAGQTAALDLERLDVDFTSDRDDEVGVLARTLGALTDRLRRGARQLREAERRATVGDLSRQVNHDIKNGLVPIRNVLRHLSEVLESRPSDLAQVLRERKGTLDQGVEYLEKLAANYARLTPTLDTSGADVAAVVAEVVAGAKPEARIELRIAAGLPPARGDRVMLRRIFENVVGNAVDTGGRVTVSTEVVSAPRPGVRITVADTGPGMTPQQLEQAFEDFYTTKPGGTGLGLSVVRRLVSDLEGALKVTSEPGRGTSVEITLPSAQASA